MADLFRSRVLEDLPVWTRKRGSGKRHAFAAAHVGRSLCGTFQGSESDHPATHALADHLYNVTCKLCRAKIISDLGAVLWVLTDALPVREGCTINFALAVEYEQTQQAGLVLAAPLLERLAILLEEVAKYEAEQKRLRQVAYHAGRGRETVSGPAAISFGVDPESGVSFTRTLRESRDP